MSYCRSEEYYDFLIECGDDPFYDPPILQQYMDKWDGQLFLQQLSLDGTQEVLEIGVGTGRVAGRVIPLCKSFTGIDLSAKSVERAKSNLSEIGEATLICGDFLTYCFQRYFDVIYSTLTMMHIADKREAVRRMVRVLNENGRIVLSLEKEQRRSIEFNGKRLMLFPDRDEEILALLREFGLRIDGVYETEFAKIIVAIR